MIGRITDLGFAGGHDKFPATAMRTALILSVDLVLQIHAAWRDKKGAHYRTRLH